MSVGAVQLLRRNASSMYFGKLVSANVRTGFGIYFRSDHQELRDQATPKIVASNSSSWLIIQLCSQLLGPFSARASAIQPLNGRATSAVKSSCAHKYLSLLSKMKNHLKSDTS